MAQVDFDGNVERLRHLHIGNNIKVLRNMRSESVDLIYLDPPFNSKRGYNNFWKNQEGKVVRGFQDNWTLSDMHIDEAHEVAYHCPEAADIVDVLGKINGDSWRAYLTMMSARLIELRRILNSTGSIYLHVDPTMSHGLKLVMDAIFGISKFRNEIVWCYSGGGISKKDYPRKHDVILRYTKSKNYVFNIERKPYKENTQQVGKHSTLSGGHAIDLERGTPITDWWNDLKTVTGWSPEKVGYDTQKPLALLERIIKASSNEGDIVLDPFCGCATTLVAAEKLHRNWIGIDMAEECKDAIKKRMRDNDILWQKFSQYDENPTGKLYERDDLPKLSRKDAKVNLYKLQGKTCPGCDKEVDYDYMDIDHIIPRTRGGQDEFRNLQLLCRKCNTSKGSKSMTEWRRDILKKKANDLLLAETKKRQDEREKMLTHKANAG